MKVTSTTGKDFYIGQPITFQCEIQLLGSGIAQIDQMCLIYDPIDFACCTQNSSGPGWTAYDYLTQRFALNRLTNQQCMLGYESSYRFNLTLNGSISEKLSHFQSNCQVTWNISVIEYSSDYSMPNLHKMKGKSPFYY